MVYSPRISALTALVVTITATLANAQNGAKPITIERCRIQLIKENEIKLAAPAPGVLLFVHPKVGETVEAEQEVAGLRDDVARAQLAVALKERENDVEKRYAIKAAELADAELAKAEEANRRLPYTVATAEIERLRLAAERAHLQIEQAEHQLEVASLRANEAQANVQLQRVVSPIHGIVTEVFQSRGEAVTLGAPIMDIINTDMVRVEGKVTLEESVQIKRGDRVKVTLTLKGQKPRHFDGVLKLVSPIADPIAQTIDVMAEVENPENVLKAGLTASMEIFPNTGEPIQTVSKQR